MNCPAYPVTRLSSQYETSRIYSTSAAKLTTSLSMQVSSWPVGAWHDRFAIFPTYLGQDHSEVSHCQHTVGSGRYLQALAHSNNSNTYMFRS